MSYSAALAVNKSTPRTSGRSGGATRGIRFLDARGGGGVSEADMLASAPDSNVWRLFARRVPRSPCLRSAAWLCFRVGTLRTLIDHGLVILLHSKRKGHAVSFLMSLGEPCLLLSSVGEDINSGRKASFHHERLMPFFRLSTRHHAFVDATVAGCHQQQCQQQGQRR